MEPLPETRFALTELSRFEDEDLTEKFTEMANRVALLAPDCVGLTVSFVRDDLAFTWAATSLDIAALDGVQYVSDGPCVESVEEGSVVEFTPSSDPLDEARWLEFARAENASGVESTLSVPLMDGSSVVGGVNFYGATPTAFEGLHSELAAECGAWAAGAVTNADLSLSGVQRAKKAPQKLRDQFVVDQAIGLIMASQQLDAAAAGERLSSAAERAGVRETELARILVKSQLLAP
jgi:GAF domain-containing protein